MKNIHRKKLSVIPSVLDFVEMVWKFKLKTPEFPTCFERMYHGKIYRRKISGSILLRKRCLNLTIPAQQGDGE